HRRHDQLKKSKSFADCGLRNADSDPPSCPPRGDGRGGSSPQSEIRNHQFLHLGVVVLGVEVVVVVVVRSLSRRTSSYVRSSLCSFHFTTIVSLVRPVTSPVADCVS